MSGGRVITGILDSQLYPILQNDDDVAGDVAVSQEIQDLIMAGTVCKLTAPLAGSMLSSSSSSALSLWILRAVQDAVERHNGIAGVASWFVAHLRDWTSGSRISLQDLVTSYNYNHLHYDHGDDQSTTTLNNNNNSSASREYSLQQVLQELQRMQILLPCYFTDTYQLWLPEWGTILAAHGTVRRPNWCKLSNAVPGSGRNDPSSLCCNKTRIVPFHGPYWSIG
jgi:hypothetical protein